MTDGTPAPIADDTPLASWLAAAATALGVPAVPDPTMLLDLARDVAHGVARPAAPLTTYLLGVAVGAGAEPAEAAALLSRLAADFAADEPAAD